MTVPEQWQVKQISDRHVRDAVRRARAERTQRNRNYLLINKMSQPWRRCSWPPERGPWWVPEALAELIGAPIDVCRRKLEQARRRNLVECGGMGLDDCRWIQDHLTDPPTEQEMEHYPGLRRWAVLDSQNTA